MKLSKIMNLDIVEYIYYFSILLSNYYIIILFKLIIINQIK